MNEARTGMTAKSLASLFAMYAKRDPDAIVQFTSCGPGGRWPEGKAVMSVFTGEQVAIVDDTRCGGGITLGVMLIEKDRS